MSKWTEVRDGVVAALDVKEVTEAAKKQLTDNLVNEGMPALEDVASKFITEIQAQAANETGWNKIRDQFVLPLLINSTIWAVKLVLSKSTTENN
ncbi:hypothetical protein [Acidaminococcus sp.]|uniref:hypothetical protein n=1 Tax=Acidaminococcus sp. TaxID=1872103 RepID=UPI003D7CD414